MPHPIIKFENVYKKYGKHEVLNKLNLEIFSGEIFGLIGSSGTGKTTFLKLLIGFIAPENGDILFRQEHLLEFEGQHAQFRSVFKSPKEVKRTFGYAAQKPSFYAKLTVEENLDYFATLYNLGREAKKTNINTLIRLMELDKARNILGQNLSGGMQRRLDIACALIHDPKILILDEPTSDLDPVLSAHIWGLIKKINKKGTTIIVASHHIADLENVCSRIGILKDGQIIHVGTLQELINQLSKGQEIHIETYPGNYEKVMKTFKHPSLIRLENCGTELVVHTSNPGTLLHELLHALEKLHENVMDVKITKLSLDDVFVNMTKK